MLYNKIFITSIDNLKLLNLYSSIFYYPIFLGFNDRIEANSGTDSANNWHSESILYYKILELCFYILLFL